MIGYLRETSHIIGSVEGYNLSLPTRKHGENGTCPWTMSDGGLVRGHDCGMYFIVRDVDVLWIFIDFQQATGTRNTDRYSEKNFLDPPCRHADRDPPNTFFKYRDYQWRGLDIEHQGDFGDNLQVPTQRRLEGRGSLFRKFWLHPPPGLLRRWGLTQRPSVDCRRSYLWTSRQVRGPGDRSSLVPWTS